MLYKQERYIISSIILWLSLAFMVMMGQPGYTLIPQQILPLSTNSMKNLQSMPRVAAVADRPRVEASVPPRVPTPPTASITPAITITATTNVSQHPASVQQNAVPPLTPSPTPSAVASTPTQTFWPLLATVTPTVAITPTMPVTPTVSTPAAATPAPTLTPVPSRAPTPQATPATMPTVGAGVTPTATIKKPLSSENHTAKREKLTTT
ncbi:MAG: hypothetical protein E6J34_14140 [Chloroflexi bacterium]|nr:MAG: hypothetical protein E6J34_14140 [Chloroflexota bacterium]